MFLCKHKFFNTVIYMLYFVQVIIFLNVYDVINDI